MVMLSDAVPQQSRTPFNEVERIETIRLPTFGQCLVRSGPHGYEKFLKETGSAKQVLGKLTWTMVLTFDPFTEAYRKNEERWALSMTPADMRKARSVAIDIRDSRIGLGQDPDFGLQQEENSLMDALNRFCNEQSIASLQQCRPKRIHRTKRFNTNESQKVLSRSIELVARLTRALIILRLMLEPVGDGEIPNSLNDLIEEYERDPDRVIRGAINFLKKMVEGLREFDRIVPVYTRLRASVIARSRELQEGTPVRDLGRLDLYVAGGGVTH